MPKRTTALPLTLEPRPSGAPAARWLYDSLRAEILGGRIGPGARLPATRDLAAQYRLSRGTVVSAFDRLRAEGYVFQRTGSGTTVSTVLPEDLRRPPRQFGRRATVVRPPQRHLTAFAQHAAFFRGYEPRTIHAFRDNQPALDLFPVTLWARVAARRLRRAGPGLLVGTEPLGYPPLQQAVADYLRTSRGVRCEPGQVAIVSGVQEALDLVARLVLDPGDRVCIEEPGYVGAARVFAAAGAVVVPVPVDAEGITLDARLWRGARLAYVTPAHQFPLGLQMSLPRRLALLARARASGTVIFEDDYDAEYRYNAQPVPALQGLDRHGTVIFSGTFSKVLFPSLRLGYLVLPPDLIDRVAAAKSVVSRHAPLLDQAVLCDFIADGHFGRHLRYMREVYAVRLRVLLDEARARLAGLVEVSDIEAGLQTVGWLSGGITDVAAQQAAAARGVEVTPISRYARTPMNREGVHLGFAAVDEEEIRRGVRELGVALRTVRSAVPAAR
jgi:GntR family transcriptional regulator / MocR family aminotransferase